jgi:ABC-2 type transport system ATP-binding protein
MSTAIQWAVELTGFAKSFATGWTGGRVTAVRGLTLRLAPGQVLGLLGPNGSGKSTTLKTLAGLLRPSAGECRIFGHPAGNNEARAEIGYLPESPQFSPHLTGRDLLEYCAGLSSIEPRAAARRVEAILQWSGLGAAAGLRVGTYSKGQAQRLGLAQAVLHDPPLLLLDEPASGLDPEGRVELSRLISELAARGKTVVFSSHLLTQAAELCDRLALLGRGRLLAEGTPAELLGTTHATSPEPSPLERLYLEKLRQDD